MKKEKIIQISIDEGLEKIDPLIKPIYDRLKKKGIKTYQSCEGHDIDSFGKKSGPYLLFEKDKKTEQAFEKVGFQIFPFPPSNPKSNIRWAIFNVPVGSIDKTKNIIGQKHMRN